MSGKESTTAPTLTELFSSKITPDDNGQNGTINGHRETDNGRSTTGDVCRASDSARSEGVNADRETAIDHFTSDSVRREVGSGRIPSWPANGNQLEKQP